MSPDLMGREGVAACGWEGAARGVERHCSRERGGRESPSRERGREDDERECRSLTLSAREWIRTKAQLGSVFTVPFFKKNTYNIL